MIDSKQADYSDQPKRRAARGLKSKLAGRDAADLALGVEMQRNETYGNFDRWMSTNDQRLKPFYAHLIGHSGVDFANAIREVAAAIKRGDSVALEIGLDLLAHDPVMPFGKTVKSRLLNALRSVAGQFEEPQWAVFVKLHKKWKAMKPYPPREMRYLEKLLKMHAADKRS